MMQKTQISEKLKGNLGFFRKASVYGNKIFFKQVENSMLQKMPKKPCLTPRDHPIKTSFVNQ